MRDTLLVLRAKPYIVLSAILVIFGYLGWRINTKSTAIKNSKNINYIQIPSSAISHEELSPTYREKPTPTITTERVIYFNRKYRYKIQYPKDWQVIEALPQPKDNSMITSGMLTLDSGEVQKVRFAGESSSDNIARLFEITVFHNPNRLTSAQWAKNFQSPLAGGGNTAKIIGNTLVSGHDAILMTRFTGNADFLSKVLIVTVREWAYVFAFGDVSYISENDVSPIYNEMVSSISITKN